MIGKIILHYNILQKLGEGGMGVVYLAEDLKLERKVAIKFLPRHIAANSEERERFKIEAKAAAALNHPNIATIYTIEEFDDPQLGMQMFIVMEYIEGKELKDIVRTYSNKPLQMDEIINYAIQIAEGLEAAHKKGILHRDIKSSNIMITNEGKAKVMDFGLAKIGQGAEITKIGTTVGTTSYMSPEQTKGADIDHRSDIWSFGVVLYEMLTGKLPFTGDYDQAILYSILNEEPRTVELSDDQKSFYGVIKKALQKDPGKRYGNLREIIQDLKSTDISSTESEKKSIKQIKKLAVLPLVNIINDPQTNFLGFALADQIISALVYSKSILIRPSSTIRKYQDKIIDIYEAGSELNVEYVLAGNYLKEADMIRLNIELVDLYSESIIWKEKVQIKYNNVFELQDIVSQKVVDGLKVQFSEEERERMKPGIPQNPLAYDYYLRAVSYPSTIENANIAIEMLNKSIELDPLYANAYLELGIRYNSFAQVGRDTQQAHMNAETALLKSLSLNKDLLPALAYLALIYTDVGRHEEAHSLLIKALKINPNDAWLHFSLSYHYRYTGFLNEAEKEIEIALSIDPKNPRFRSYIIVYMFLGKYDEILESFDLESGSPFTLNYLGEVAFRKGNKELALDYLEKSLKIKDEIGEFYFAASLVEYIKGNPDKAAEYNLKRELENPVDSEIWYEIARFYGLFNMKEACCRALNKSINMGYISYPSMQRDTFLDSVRSDPEILDLLSKAKEKHEDLKRKLVNAENLKSYLKTVEDKTINEKPAVNSPVPEVGKKKKIFVLTGIMILLIAVSLIIWNLISSHKPVNTAASLSLKRIAVLPFTNVNNNAEVNFLSFALADQIINSLAYIRDILVRPSSSIRPYQNEVVDISAAAKKLNVEYILSGSYQKESDEIRLNVELVEVSSNKLVWHDGIEVKYENAFKLQDIVSQKVVDGLKVKFSPKESGIKSTDVPNDPLAYEYFLRGVSYPVNNEGNQAAIDFLTKSIQIDSNFAPSYSELGYRYHTLATYELSKRDKLKNAESAYKKALSINNESLSALGNLASLYTETGKTSQAVELTRRALEINPNNAQIHFWLGYIFRYTGLLDKAAEEMETAVKLDPANKRFRSIGVTFLYQFKYKEAIEGLDLDKGSPYSLAFKGQIYYRMNKIDSAKKYFEKVIKIEPDGSLGRWSKAMLDFLNGNKEDGLVEIKTLEMSNVFDAEQIYNYANLYGLYGDKKDCVRLLEKAIDGGFYCYPFMSKDSFLDPVRDDKKFMEVMAYAKSKYEEFKKSLGE